MKQCIDCLSTKIASVVDKNHIFYLCNNCGKKNSRCFETGGSLKTKLFEGQEVHVSVVALIERDDKILLIKRKDYPYGYCLPVGHVYAGESLSRAISRKVLEETGLSVISKERISSLFIKGECKFGLIFHIWNVYKCKCSGGLLPGFETEKTVWIPKNEVEKLNLIDRTRFTLEKIGVIQNKTLDIEVKPMSKAKFQMHRDIRGQSFIQDAHTSLSYLATMALGQNNLDESVDRILKQAVLEFGLASCSIQVNKRIFRYSNITKKADLLFQKFETELRRKKIKGASCISEHNNLLILSIPVKLKSKEAGMLFATKNSKNFFGEEEIKTLGSLASKIAITLKQIETEQELLYERNMLRKIFNTTSNGIILLDRNFKPIFLNKEAKQIINEPKTEIYQHINKHKRTIANDVIIRGKSKEYAFESNSPYKYFKMIISPIIDKDSFCSEILVVINDLTEHKLHEMEIVSEKEKIAKIINNTKDGILVFDQDSNVVLSNDSMALINNFISGNDLAPKLSKFASILNKEHNLASSLAYKEIKLKDSDNDDYWLGVNYSTLGWGNQLLIIAVIRDIMREKMLEQKQKDFIYTITHELRTPITAIKGYLSMILNGDSGKISAGQKKYFEKAYSSTDRLVGLVEDILKSSRLENEIFAKEQFKPDLILKEIADDFGQKAKQKNLELVVEKPSDKIYLLGDQDKTRQAIANLVDNAIKYTKRGNVRLSASKNGKYGEIEVEDTGIGMTHKECNMIFDKFYRSNNRLINESGTGLGLYIVKNIIEKQNGKIILESKPGKGSKFKIMLPAVSK